MTRRCLRAVNRAGRPFAAYLHPWEIDPEQPRLPAGRFASFRHYVNLRHTEARLTRILRDFRFGTLSESLASWRHEKGSPRPHDDVGLPSSPGTPGRGALSPMGEVL